MRDGKGALRQDSSDVPLVVGGAVDIAGRRDHLPDLRGSGFDGAVRAALPDKRRQGLAGHCHDGTNNRSFVARACAQRVAAGRPASLEQAEGITTRLAQQVVALTLGIALQAVFESAGPTARAQRTLLADGLSRLTATAA